MAVWVQVKPSGRVLLLEHSRSDNALLASYQRMTSETVAATGKGCVWDQVHHTTLAQENLHHCPVAIMYPCRAARAAACVGKHATGTASPAFFPTNPQTCQSALPHAGRHLAGEASRAEAAAPGGCAGRPHPPHRGTAGLRQSSRPTSSLPCEPTVWNRTTAAGARFLLGVSCIGGSSLTLHEEPAAGSSLGPLSCGGVHTQMRSSSWLSAGFAALLVATIHPLEEFALSTPCARLWLSQHQDCLFESAERHAC